ncbi:MAG: VWA domain-containing protein [Acidobacteriota bacterium]
MNTILREGDTAFLMSFDEQSKLLAPPESSRAALDAGLAKLTAPGSSSNGTALFDAIGEAAQLAQPILGRKAIVILSDGFDTASAAPIGDVITAAQRANLAIFPIRFYDLKVFAFQIESPAWNNLRAGKRTLERLAKDTGGGFYEIAAKRSLDENFTRMAAELRQQYSLGFVPASGSGYRKLRVNVRRRGLNVQARDGYFATE